MAGCHAASLIKRERGQREVVLARVVVVFAVMRVVGGEGNAVKRGYVRGLSPLMTGLEADPHESHRPLGRLGRHSHGRQSIDIQSRELAPVVAEDQVRATVAAASTTAAEKVTWSPAPSAPAATSVVSVASAAAAGGSRVKLKADSGGAFIDGILQELEAAWRDRERGASRSQGDTQSCIV